MKKYSIILISAVLSVLAGCATSPDEDFYGGRIVGQDELDALYSMVAAADTDRYPSVTDELGEEMYFWTKNGSVRHRSPGCQSLASSSEVLSGTAEEAISAGKEKVCAICGKEK